MKIRNYLGALLLILVSFFSYSQKPEIVLQQGHKDAIVEIAFNAKGSIMATGSKDGRINLIDPYTGLIIHTLKGHTEKVIRLIFSNNNKHLISGSSKEIIVWDLLREKELFRTKYGLKHRENLAISNDGLLLAFSRNTSQPDILFIDEQDHEFGDKMISVKIEERLAVRSLEFTNDGNNLLIGSSNSAYFWNIKKQVLSFKLPTQQLPRVNYIDHNKGQYFAANNYLNWQVWDLNKGKYLDNFEGKKGDDNELDKYDFAIFNSKHTILGVTADDYFKLYDLKNGSYLRKCEALKKPIKKEKIRKGGITAAAFNPRGELLVVATQFTYYDLDEPLVLLRYFDVSSGREIRMTDGYHANVNLVKFSPDDKKLAITGSKPTKIWSLAKAENCVENLGEKTNKPLGVFWSPDSKVILTHGGYTMLTDLSTKDEKPYDKHFYYRYGIYTGKNLQVSRDFKVLMGTNRAHNYFTGEIFCEFDLKKDYFRKEVGKPSTRDHPMIITPDNNTLIVMEYNNYSQGLISLTFIDLQNCKKSGVMDIPTKSKNGRSFVRDNYQIKISQTGKYIAILGEEIEIIDIKSRAIILSIKGEAERRRLPYNDASFNFDDKYIALAGHNGLIKVWDINEKKEVHSLKGHQDQVTSVSFKHKKNTLASGGMDDRVILWNAETGEKVATMINIDDNDYIVTTPDRYYFSSKDALKNAAFRYKNQMLPFEQFDLKYNRPDKVIKRIGTASIIKIKMYKKAYEKRLRKSGFTEEMLGDEFNLPRLTVTDKYGLMTTTSNPSFTFNVKGNDQLYPLDRLLVYINNVPITGPKGIDVSKAKSKTLEKELKVELSRGLNKIQVSVINSKGVESIRDAFEIALDKEKIKPDLYLLAVGISEYNNESRNLTYAAKDAQDISKALEKSDRYNKVHVKLVLNKDATKNNILKTATFLKESKIDDHVVLYISSHGLLDDQLDYYLATTDVDFDNPSEKGLPYDKVEQLLENVKSRNRLVLIDACHSGEIDKEEMVLADANTNQHVKATAKSGDKIVVPKTGLKNSFTYMQVLFSDVSKGLGATVISAAGGMEFAYETNDKKNGIFTYSIIEGLESNEADINKDDKIQLSELQIYIQYKVHQLSGGLQIPTTRKINSYNDFVIY